MRRISSVLLVLTLAVLFNLMPCLEAAQVSLRVTATLSFLADIAQNVAGDRVKVNTMVPLGVDPHVYEPSPGDMARMADSHVLIVHGQGIEGFLERLVKSVGTGKHIIYASHGIEARHDDHHDCDKPDCDHYHGHEHHDEHHHHEGDPHFWFNPKHVIQYVENIKHGLIHADPAGAAIYRRNAAAYAEKLKELDTWIENQVKGIPEAKRILVTNHESLGHFADRYGFKIIGTVVPSHTTGASPSAQQVAQLIRKIRETGAKAIFLETGSSPQIARQIAAETGVTVVTGLHTHSLTDSRGVAPTYIDMMRHNTSLIVGALR